MAFSTLTSTSSENRHEEKNGVPAASNKMRKMGRITFACNLPLLKRVFNGVMKDDLIARYESTTGFHGKDADQIRLG